MGDALQMQQQQVDQGQMAAGVQQSSSQSETTGIKTDFASSTKALSSGLSRRQVSSVSSQQMGSSSSEMKSMSMSSSASHQMSMSSSTQMSSSVAFNSLPLFR